MKKLVYIFIFLGICTTNYAQEILTQDRAIQLTLENNYDIKVSINDVEVAKNNSSIYNSGYLPTLTGNAGTNYNNNNTDSETHDDLSTSIDNSESTTYNASLSLNYVLFDGFNRKYNYEKLQGLYGLTELQARQTIENILIQVYFVYYEVARLTENTKNKQNTLDISKQRLKRSEYSFEFGQGTKLDILNSEVDVNNDSIEYLDSKRLLINTKRDLNVLMGKDVGDTSYDVDITVTYEFLNLNELLIEAKEKNVLLLQVNKNIELNNYDIRINKSGWMPIVSASGSYNWNKFVNDQTFNIANQNTNGLGAGLNLSWNVFDGGKTKTRVQNAKINLETQEIVKEQVEQQVKRDISNAWETYQNALFTLQVQESNVITNKRNFDRTNEQYKLGQVNSIDFRKAQVDLLNAELSLSKSKYDAKNAELYLIQLAGNLVM